jgi:hypothetical protein
MSELEKIPQKKDKLTNFQERYNTTSKGIVHIIGTNIALFICTLLPILLIGLIWTDFGMPTLGIKFFSDGIVTVVLFVIGEMLMMRVGADGGKLDSDYISAKTEFNNMVKKVYDVGTMFMHVFCEWQVDVELDQAIVSRLRRMRLTRADWNVIKDIPYEELCKKYGRKKAKKIIDLTQLEPIELNEAILLFDNGNANSRGGVPMSGETYIEKKTHSFGTVLSLLFAGLLTISVAITMTSDISFARVMYTAFKLVVLLYRMAMGYALGAKAYNTVEVRQLQAKCHYLNHYLKFVNDKTYLKFGDKYGDISCFIEDTPTVEVTPSCTNLDESYTNLTPTNTTNI